MKWKKQKEKIENILFFFKKNYFTFIKKSEIISPYLA